MRLFTSVKRQAVARFPFMEKLQRFLYRFKPYKLKFRTYYLDSGWGEGESRSGPGSGLKSTEETRKQLPYIFRQFNIRTLADIPCGDFFWMKYVDLTGIDYFGFDIVQELIESNTKNFATKGIHFDVLDLMKDDLPAADLILCRDCLIHFPQRMIFQGLQNIVASRSIYLLSTTTPGLTLNRDLDAIGLYRPINLQILPYNLPKPLFTIRENLMGTCLCLWKIDDISIEY